MKYVMLILSLLFWSDSLIAQNWVRVDNGVWNIPAGIYEIEFFNDSIGTCYGVIRTDDRGKTWYRDSLVIDEEQKFFGYGIGSIQSLNDTLAVGLTTNLTDKSSLLCKSYDRGKTWTTKPIAKLFQDDRLTSLHFYDENHGIAMGGRNAFPNINIDGAYTFTTRDGGNMWDTVAAYYGDSEFNGYPYSVWMTDTNTIWATGERYWELQYTYHFVKASCDGGYTWNCGGGPSLTYTNGRGSGFGSLYFINKQLGFVSGDSALWRTTDGVSFKRHVNQHVAATHFDKTGKYGAAIYSVDYDVPNGNINNRRYLLRTSDSGTTWGLQSIQGATSQINNVYVLDSLVTILVGDNGLILRTENGGGPVTPVTVVSIEDEREVLKELHIYPNPAADEFLIDGGSGELALISSFGEVVWRGFKTEEKLKIDVSALPQGIYVLKHSAGAQMISVVR